MKRKNAEKPAGGQILLGSTNCVAREQEQDQPRTKQTAFKVYRKTHDKFAAHPIPVFQEPTGMPVANQQCAASAQNGNLETQTHTRTPTHTNTKAKTKILLIAWAFGIGIGNDIGIGIGIGIGMRTAPRTDSTETPC